MGFKQGHVTFESRGRVNLAFFQFVCGLEKVKYSFNDQNSLDQEIPIPKCDRLGSSMFGTPDLSRGEFKFPPGSPFEVGYGGFSVTWEVPHKTEVIYFQFFYKDGTKSEIESLFLYEEDAALQAAKQHDREETNKLLRKGGMSESDIKDWNRSTTQHETLDPKLYSRTETIAMFRDNGFSNCEIKEKLDRQDCRAKERAKGEDGDVSECDDSGGLSGGQQVGLSAIPYVGGLLALGSMLANEAGEDNLKSDDCDLGETKAEDTKPSSGGVLGGLFGGSGDEGTKTENTDSSTGDSEENDLFKDDDDY